MNSLTTFLLIPLLTASPRTDAVDARTVFIAKCTMCHSVESEGIEAKGATKALGIDWKRLCDECMPDLSTVGEKRTDAEWLNAYLKGKKKGRNGLKHDDVPITLGRDRLIMQGGPLLVTWTDEGREALVRWLITLKKRTN